ncbi:hypothetical protein NHX12_008229 [Muraenolepis orangiensis]|uniref:Delta-like protein n=1 Tax=Muraenolepis orangiensis TaxID=630683 RepID=A0A9Q0I9L2_9TELE|nr:hypothetical protein NHX12_008229 [Muraenolepis orangiensis]
MARELLSSLLLLSFTLSVACSGMFELKIDSFTSAHGACASSQSQSQKEGEGEGGCRVFFSACLKHPQEVVGPAPQCTYGAGRTDVFRVDAGSVAASAPIRVPFHFKWPGSFSLILEAWSAAAAEEEEATDSPPMSRLAAGRSVAVGEAWSRDAYQDDLSAVRFSYRALCDAHYHGDACAAYCRPRDDNFGHYSCDVAGSKVCLDGWTGEYCAIPICSPGCSSEHGECKAPGQCDCRLGWTGPRCDRCQQHPGCLHGTCQQPWQCECKEGWGGLFCNEDLNYCTNHQPCQNQAACSNTGQGSYTCTCRPGYSGKDCELEVHECDSSPCRNGGSCTDLEAGFSCSCPQGFYGNTCEVSAMTCGDGPCFNGGTCEEAELGAAYRCHCPAGFTGSNCEKKLDRCSSSPCANGGKCVDGGHQATCSCRLGFSGPFCRVNVDDCAAGPCLNAGTCVDGVGGFTCRCALGFSGADCSVRADACAREPCLNGGTCFTHISGPVCRCPAGYMGRRCDAPGKVSNKDAALDHMALFKNKMADYNLAREEDALGKNKFDLKKCDPPTVVPSLGVKGSLYQPIFILPEPTDHCVFATELSIKEEKRSNRRDSRGRCPRRRGRKEGSILVDTRGGRGLIPRLPVNQEEHSLLLPVHVKEIGGVGLLWSPTII